MYSRQGFTLVISSLAERFSCELSWPRGFSFVLSAGIHLGEFFLGRDVFFRTLLTERRRDFSFVLSAGIHLGEFFLGREVFFNLSWARGFLSNSRQGFNWVNSSLAKRFSFNSQQGFTSVNSSLAERFSFNSLGRELLFHALGRDSLR